MITSSWHEIFLPLPKRWTGSKIKKTLASLSCYCLAFFLSTTNSYFLARKEMFMFLINIIFLIRDISHNITSPPSVKLWTLHSPWPYCTIVVVVIISRLIIIMALVFLGHCLAIYGISKFTGRSPILSFKQRLLSLGTQQLWTSWHVANWTDTVRTCRYTTLDCRLPLDRNKTVATVLGTLAAWD